MSPTTCCRKHSAHPDPRMLSETSRQPSHNGVSLLADAHLLPDRILFGAAFYDEYRVNGDLERDLDLMAEASFSVIRVGESVWATWEPEPGVYHLDWLQPVLDGAHARGISVVLGTPTYAVPPWLRAMDPDLAGEERHRRAPSLGEAPGGRHHASAVPSARGGRHPGDRREVRRPSGDHRLPGRQRARPVPAAQPARVRRVPALARGPLRGCRDAQPRVGAHVLVAAHPQLGRALATRWQHLAAVPARVAPLPGRDRHRLHRVAGRHRARVRAIPASS